VVVGWALAGCEQDAATRDATGASADTSPEPADPSTGPSSGSAQADEELDPDVRLLGERVADVEQVAALVAATRRRHRRLRPRLGPLVALHEAHRAVLDEAGDHAGAAPDPAPRVPRGADRALALVLRQEEQHARTLARSAVEASSGGFARLLASMAAGVDQHLTEVRA
jgi:hypothetical protein